MRLNRSLFENAAKPMPYKHPIHRFLLPLLMACMTLSSCARNSGQEAVSVSAINYTDQELNGYLFESLEDKEKYAGGEPVRPFEGGGSMCCFSLPAKWRPGIKVRVRYDWWQGPDAPRKYQQVEREIPPYPDGQVGTLWALFYPDGAVEVVSSEFAPGHAKWPGKVKGWPVPTLEHRRKLWQMDYDEALWFVTSLSKLRDESEGGWKKKWEDDQTYAPQMVRSFKGYDDPAYRAHTRKADHDALQSARERLQQLQEVRP
ncbi:MAG: DUF3304 domain-containing protein [Aquabacterium sp.]